MSIEKITFSRSGRDTCDYKIGKQRVNMRTLISIIVPVYNAEQYLEQCIDSILNQSLKEIELILINDGSTDMSGKICEQYACRDHRVRIFHQDNHGPIAARKKGLIESRCEYVVFVDSDDFVAYNSYVLATESLQNGIDMIMFGITRYYDAENERVENSNFPEKIYNRQDIKKHLYKRMIWDKERKRFGIDPSLCNKIMKKELVISCYEKMENMRFHYGEDVAIVYPMIKEAKTIEIKHRSYYYHRLRKSMRIPEYIADKTYFEKLYMLYKYLADQFCDEEILIQQIEYFYMYSVELRKHIYGDYQKGTQYLFPFDKVGKGDKVVIYGAGLVGHSYKEQLSRIEFCKVVLWVDKSFRDFVTDGVSSIEEIQNVSFDKVVIAIESEEISKNIKEMLVEMGVKQEKIVSGFLN